MSTLAAPEYMSALAAPEYMSALAAPATHAGLLDDGGRQAGRLQQHVTRSG